MNSLDGVRILDLSRVLAGPWCTQTLADLGATVIKVERPGVGDDTRSWGPPFLPTENGRDSTDAAYFLATNRNKQSITCDIATPQGQALIKRLVQHSDVFVENYKVGDMARYGLDFASLQAMKPSLVYCSITGYGQTGPYKDRAGYDYAIQGMGGLMSVTGERDELGGGPQKVGVAVADLFTGMYSAVAILAALRHAEATGIGQHIDMALLDTQVAMLANLGANYLVKGKSEGKVPGRSGNAHANIVPYQMFEVKALPENNGAPTEKDYLILAVGNDKQFSKFCDVAGRPDLAKDSLYATNQNRVRNRKQLIPILEQIMLCRSKQEWLDVLNEAQIPCGPINKFSEVFTDPQVLARQMVNHHHHPLNAHVALVANPIKLSATPVRVDGAPPILGQHTHQVLTNLLGMSPHDIDQLHQQGIL